MANRTETAEVRLKINGQEIPNSYKDLQAAQRRVKKELQGLEVGTKKYRQESAKLKEVNKRLDMIRQDINKNSKSWKKQTTEFKAGLKDRIAGMSIYGQSIRSISSNYSTLTGSIGGASKAARIFRMALLATGVGAIVIGLAALVSYLTKVQSGMNLVSKVTTVVGAVFEQLIGRLAKLGGALIKFFSGDFKGAGEDLKATFTGVGDAIVDTIKKANDLADTRILNRRLDRESNRLIARLETQSEALNSIADDATRSFEQRESAAKKAREVEVRITTERLKLAQREANLINREIALKEKAGTVTDDLLDKQLEAQKVLFDAEKQQQLVFLEGEKRKRELIQDRLERDLDILIDGFDNQKTINEKLITDDELTLGKRKALLEETTRLATESFEQQIATIQKFTDAQLDANDLLNTSNATLLQEKIRELNLSEIIEGRLLEVVRERKTVLSDVVELERDLSAEKLAQQELQRNAAIESLDLAANEELLLLKQRVLEEKITIEEFNEEKEALELAHLLQMKAYKEQLGFETLDLEQQIADKQIEILRRKYEEEKKLGKTIREIAEQKTEALINETAAVIENAESFKQASRGILNALRNQVKGFINEAVVVAVGKALKEAPFPLNIALAPVAGATAAALFDKFSSFYHGGPTGSKGMGIGDQYGQFTGFTHGDEFVLSKAMLNDPYVANVARYVETNTRAGQFSQPVTTAPQEVNVTSKLDASGMNSAVDRLYEIAVLQSQGMKLKFSRRDGYLFVENALEDIADKDQAKDRSK